MSLAELQREIDRLDREDQRKLIGYLVAADVRRDPAYRAEIARRLEDQKPENWINLKDARRELSSDGV
jgi:hypothetical protein